MNFTQCIFNIGWFLTSPWLWPFARQQNTKQPKIFRILPLYIQTFFIKTTHFFFFRLFTHKQPLLPSHHPFFRPQRAGEVVLKLLTFFPLLVVRNDPVLCPPICFADRHLLIGFKWDSVIQNKGTVQLTTKKKKCVFISLSGSASYLYVALLLINTKLTMFFWGLDQIIKCWIYIIKYYKRASACIYIFYQSTDVIRKAYPFR